MAKPVITRRQTKGTPLTYSELDTNFDNLRDSTVSLKAGSAGTTVASDLNGTITLVAGSGISLAGDNSAKTVTITNTGASVYYNAGSSGSSTWTPDYANGNVQKRSSSAGSLTVNAPTGMSAGNSIKLIISVSFFGSNATVAFSGMIVSNNNDRTYFENSSTVTFVSGSGNLTLDIVYDGSSYWTVLNTNYV